MIFLFYLIGYFIAGACLFYCAFYVILNWRKIVNFFKRSCPACEIGNLYNTDCHLTKNNVQLEIYECDNCGETFI